MPLVKIETRKELRSDEKAAIFEAVHQALVTAFKIPEHDRNQRIVEYDSADFEASRGKGARFMIVTIEAFAGRSLDAKRQLYREIVGNLEPLGIPPADVLIVIHDVSLDCWGVQGGRAGCDVDLGFDVRV